MRRAARVDGNHREIVDALEKVGHTVIDFSNVGRGIPDLWCAKAGKQFWVEVKDGSLVPSARKLTPAQLAFRAKLARAGVHVHVVSSIAEALAL